MKKTIEVTFPGGKRVNARIGEMIVRTDQSKENGGGETAPEPFQLFLASIATCAGIYALEFCRSREIGEEGLSLSLGYEFDERKHACERLKIDLRLPAGFPEKYKRGILKSMDLCTVKRHIVHPPEFIITVS